MTTWTFQQYDELVDLFGQFKSSVPVHWPTPIEFDIFEEDPDKWIPFLIWLSEKCKPKSKADEYSKKNINIFLTKHLDLVDEITEDNIAQM